MQYTPSLEMGLLLVAILCLVFLAGVSLALVLGMTTKKKDSSRSRSTSHEEEAQDVWWRRENKPWTKEKSKNRPWPQDAKGARPEGYYTNDRKGHDVPFYNPHSVCILCTPFDKPLCNLTTIRCDQCKEAQSWVAERIVEGIKSSKTMARSLEQLIQARTKQRRSTGYDSKRQEQDEWWCVELSLLLPVGNSHDKLPFDWESVMEPSRTTQTGEKTSSGAGSLTEKHSGGGFSSGDVAAKNLPGEHSVGGSPGGDKQSHTQETSGRLESLQDMQDRLRELGWRSPGAQDDDDRERRGGAQGTRKRQSGKQHRKSRLESLRRDLDRLAKQMQDGDEDMESDGEDSDDVVRLLADSDSESEVSAADQDWRRRKRAHTRSRTRSRSPPSKRAAMSPTASRRLTRGVGRAASPDTSGHTRTDEGFRPKDFAELKRFIATKLDHPFKEVGSAVEDQRSVTEQVWGDPTEVSPGQVWLGPSPFTIRALAQVNGTLAGRASTEVSRKADVKEWTLDSVPKKGAGAKTKFSRSTTRDKWYTTMNMPPIATTVGDEPTLGQEESSRLKEWKAARVEGLFSLYAVGFMERCLSTISKILADDNATKEDEEFIPKLLMSADNTLKHLSASQATLVGMATVACRTTLLRKERGKVAQRVLAMPVDVECLTPFLEEIRKEEAEQQAQTVMLRTTAQQGRKGSDSREQTGRYRRRPQQQQRPRSEQGSDRQNSSFRGRRQNYGRGGNQKNAQSSGPTRGHSGSFSFKKSGRGRGGSY